jgi:hypothetical protein
LVLLDTSDTARKNRWIEFSSRMFCELAGGCRK